METSQKWKLLETLEFYWNLYLKIGQHSYEADSGIVEQDTENIQSFVYNVIVQSPLAKEQLNNNKYTVSV